MRPLSRFVLISLLYATASAAHDLYFAGHDESQPTCGLVAKAFVTDFNRDGKRDVAGLLFTGELFTIAGNGNGTFQPCTITTAAIPIDTVFAITDLDGDGIADVMARPKNGSALLILRGKSDGTFSTPETVTLSDVVNFVAVGDLNGDGRNDVVVSWRHAIGGGGVSVLLNQGNSFGVTTSFDFTKPDAVAIADFNKDQKADIVVVDEQPADGRSVMAYIPGNGDGTFGAVHPVTRFTTIGTADLVDVNGDGLPDAVVRYADRLYIVLGRGDSTTPDIVTSFVTSFVGQASAAQFVDVDGDGIPDCVANAAAIVFVSKGRGDGSFELPRAFMPRALSPFAMAVADFDGDHHPDVLVFGGAPNMLGFLRGMADGSLNATEGFLCGSGANVLADVNGDGHPDFIGTDYVTDILTVFANDGTGHFSKTSETLIDQSVSHGRPYAADFDGDGHVDVAMIYNENVAVYFGDGAGHFTAGGSWLIPVGANPFPIVAGVGSFTGNAQQQLVLTTVGESRIIAPHRDGTYSTVAIVPFYASTCADVDGDGRTDLIAPLGVGFNDGGGHFSFVSYSERSAYVDVDGDGTLDAVSTQSGHTSLSTWFFLKIQRIRRDRTSIDQPVIGTTTGPSEDMIRASGAAYDFNGDGASDLFSLHSIYLNRGDGTFEPTERVLDGASPAGDLDGDGRTDLLWTNGQVAVPLLNRPSPAGPQAAQLAFQIADSSFGSGAAVKISAAGATGRPGGFFTIREGNTIVGLSSNDLNNGGYPLMLLGLLAGTHHLIADYSGDATYAATSIDGAASVARSPVALAITFGGNYARLSIPVTVTIAPEEYKVLGPLTGTVTLIAKDTVVGTVPAATQMHFDVSLPSGTFYLGAHYSGDANHSPSARDQSGIFVVDPPIALDKTAIAVTPAGDNQYYIDVTFRDKDGVSVGTKVFWLDVRVTATNGTVSGPDGPNNPRRWVVRLPKNGGAAVSVTINGVAVATTYVGASPPRRRAAGH